MQQNDLVLEIRERPAGAANLATHRPLHYRKLKKLDPDLRSTAGPLRTLPLHEKIRLKGKLFFDLLVWAEYGYEIMQPTVRMFRCALCHELSEWGGGCTF